ncbi:phage tail length tape measure family protein [Caproicibacterium sp. NSD3]
MSSENGLGGSVGLDTTAFKKGVTELNAQMKSIETSFRASAAVMEDWSSSTQGLSERVSSLQDKLKLQKQALETLNSAYQKTVSEQGADSKSAQSLANQMYTMEGKISSTEKQITKYSTALKEAKSNTSPLSEVTGKLKSTFTSLADSSKKTTSNIKDHFSGLANSIKGYVAGAVAALSIKDIAEATDTAEKTMAQMDAVLKSTGGTAGVTKDQLLQLADSQSKVTTYSKGTTEQAENMMLTFTNVGSNVFPQAIKSAENMATAMGTSATDAAKTLGKALNDPTNGLSKLTKQGVTFTDEQKKQIKAMQASGDTAGAQMIMLNELEKEFGGSAEAAGQTLTGQIQIMQNNLKGAGVSIATALLPVINQVMPSIISGVQSVADFVTAHKDQIIGVIQNIINFVQQAAGVVGDAINAAKPFIEPIISDIEQIVSNLFPNVQDGLSGISSMISGGVSTALGAVRTALDWMAQHGDVVKAALIGISTGFIAIKAAISISEVISKAKEGIESLSGVAKGAKVFENLFGMSPKVLAIIAIITVVATIASLIIANWGNVVQFFQGVANGIKAAFNGIGAWFQSVFSAAAQVIQAVWGGITGFFGGIWNGICAVFSAVGGWFGGIFNGAANIIQGAWGGITGFFGGIWDGICSIFSAVGGWFGDVFNGAANIIQDAWSGITGFFSGIWDGITGVFGAVGDWFGQVFGAAADAIQSAWGGITGFFSSIWDGISSGFRGFIDFFVSGLNAVIDAIDSIHVDIPSWSPIAPGQRLGFSIPEVPYFANGGIVDRATLLMAGESGKEAIMPLENNTAWIKSLARDLATEISSVTISSANRPYPQTIDKSVTKSPVININGPVNVQDKGSKSATLQQLQFLAEV